MSGSDDAKRVWVERVLGFRFGAAPPTSGAAADGAQSTDVHDLNARLLSAGNALRALRDASAPDSTGLAVRFGELVAAAKIDPAAVAASLDALEGEIARATSAARGREAGMAKGRGVSYRKLLLRWREAQAALASSVEKVGATLLARADVRADPRIEDVKQAVAELPKLVPKFGGELEATLDADLNASDPAASARLAAQAIEAIDTYRRQLAAAAQLLDLEDFAAKDLGTPLPLHSALDQVLVELKQQLAA